MLIKEYRISLPMSVEEYRIAQLYMIQKKSREESHGAGSGVEILENQPYTEGPGGSGQYTYKIYHIGSHLPGWFRAILPKSALRVEEEAWNAYPYTKTRYRCPFVEKFVLEIETKYLNDGGELDNIFGMVPSEMKERTVDYIDIVKDQISSGDYKKEEDPKLFKSQMTARGPLNDNWREEYCRAARQGNKSKAIMTAYKLCRVEFKYWGMQNKIERFIHDIGLRKTMLRAHRQAWCWQDEYYGLELSDIRRLEKETQLALQQTMAEASDVGDTVPDSSQGPVLNNTTDVSQRQENEMSTTTHGSRTIEKVQSVDRAGSERAISPGSQSSRHSTRKKGSTHKLSVASARSKSSIDSSQLSDWRVQSLEQLQESSSDEEEFFDAQGLDDMPSVFNSDYDGCESDSDSERAWETIMVRSSSMETLSVSNDEFADARSTLSSDPGGDSHVGRRLEKLCQKYSLETGMTGSQERPPTVTPRLCKINTLFLVIHGGSVLDSANEHFNTSKRSDYSMLKSTFEGVIKTHYSAAKGSVAFRLVPCPQICADTLSVLSSLSPFGFDAKTPSNSEGGLPWSQEFVPLGAVALFSACSPEYQDHVNSVVAKANLVYIDFIKSDEGAGFTGQVCIIADATGSVMTYDALCRSRLGLSRTGSNCGSHSSLTENEPEMPGMSDSTRTLCQSDTDISKSTNQDGKPDDPKQSKSDIVSCECILRQPTGRQNSVRLNVTPSSVESGDPSYRRTSTESQFDSLKFEFDVADFFMLGSPLGLVLAYRRLYAGDDKTAPPVKPDCQQLYNLFHASDPTAFRIEPLINFVFKQIPPIRLARFNKFPMGDGESIHLVETVCNYVHIFTEQLFMGSGPGATPRSQLMLSLQRQASVTSTCSQMSGLSTPDATITSIANVSSKWWGCKRMDYMLYCPEVLHSFPVRALPPLFHASFWESTDMAAFVLRQVLRQDTIYEEMGEPDMGDAANISHDNQPKEKWLKRRTMLKVRNLQANHRGNDVLVLEDKPQVLTAKFMYGPLDMTSLSGEKTDVHVMSTSGEWSYMGTEVTDGHGRLNFTVPADKQLSQGIHPVKMVVRVDHTTTDMFLTVLPPKTETVIFSIDGSFTASVSIMGKDPKVRAGAVDVVRHWQEFGYLILYVTARPDMQHNKVVAWLAQHNFPHGMVAFMDGFSKDPLRQKFSYLRHLQADADLQYVAGYGSSKDINGYRDLGLKKEQIFIVGKPHKKQQLLATFISAGYAAHLELLMNPGASRPASGNAKLLLRKSCFSLPAHSENKRSSKRSSTGLQPPGTPSFDTSGFMRQESSSSQTLITVAEAGNTQLQPMQPNFGSAVRARGTSPRPKISFEPPR